MDKKVFSKVLTIILIVFSVACVITAIVAPIVIINKRNQNDSTSEAMGPNVSNSEAKTAIEKYGNDNSVSLMFETTPDAQYATDIIENTINYLNLGSYWTNPFQQTKAYSIDCGTAWLIDYCLPNNNGDLATYYLATNIHVINLAYTINVQFPAINKTLDINIPVNNTTSDNIGAFISQPIGPTSNGGQHYEPISNDPTLWQYEWFKLPDININTINNQIIPIGAFNEDGTMPSITQTNNLATYTLSTVITNQTGTSTTLSQSSLIQPTSNGNLSFVNGVPAVNNNNRGQDFGVVKTSFDPSTIVAPTIPYNHKLSNLAQMINQSFKNMREMFTIKNPTVNNANVQDEPKNYISRLNYLVSTLQKVKQNLNGRSLNEDEQNQLQAFFNKWYMFAIPEIGQTITVSGFPGINDSQTNISYVAYRTASLEANTKNMIWAGTSISRPLLTYFYQGQQLNSNYNNQDNYYITGINLGHGSSGSMVMNQNYQIIGIYWGATSSNAGSAGVFTPLIEGTKNSPNLVTRLVNYERQINEQNSQLSLLYSLSNSLNIKLN